MLGDYRHHICLLQERVEIDLSPGTSGKVPTGVEYHGRVGVQADLARPLLAKAPDLALQLLDPLEGGGGDGRVELAVGGWRRRRGRILAEIQSQLIDTSLFIDDQTCHFSFNSD